MGKAGIGCRVLTSAVGLDTRFVCASGAVSTLRVAARCGNEDIPCQC